ncbi:hypothetical protein [Bifidobacterium mongoliense]|uniref:hypothetical protein n=1 Tax=Bifidobacterium mongoliense TaxID=518643 RepID=UPI0012E0721B|nr:hypothetical protein [Bifidobacterium mongoliense]
MAKANRLFAPKPDWIMSNRRHNPMTPPIQAVSRPAGLAELADTTDAGEASAALRAATSGVASGVGAPADSPVVPV